MGLREEIEDLLSRLTTEEQEDLLNKLRERFKQERAELRAILGKDEEKV